MNAQVAESPSLTASDIYPAHCVNFNATFNAATVIAADAKREADTRRNLVQLFSGFLGGTALLICLMICCICMMKVRPTW